MSKYHALRPVYDSLIWDSKLELNVYKWLCKTVRYQKSDVTLEVKPGVIVKPKCAVFKERKWKCDFRLVSKDDHINLEVKGFNTRDFMLTLEMLEYCNPDEFAKTYVLTENTLVMDKYKKLGERLIWLPNLVDTIVDPANWNK
jgi:hypothetical protein